MTKTTFWSGGLWWTALGVTGLGSVALGCAVWFERVSEGTPWVGHFGHGWAGWGLFLALGIVALVFSASRRHVRMGGEARAYLDPVAEAAEAYAQGRLTREQYFEKKAVLEEKP